MAGVKFSQKLAATICERLANGESLQAICRSEGMPVASTVLEWAKDESKQPFGEQYARAREQGYALLADELVAIADASTPDDVQVGRLRVDTRKWMLSKMLPKVYGDKVEHSGELSLKHEGWLEKLGQAEKAGEKI